MKICQFILIWMFPFCLVAQINETYVSDSSQVLTLFLDGDTIYELFREFPEDGTWVIYYDADKKQKAFETRYRSRKNIGPERSWYPNGQLKSLIVYAVSEDGKERQFGRNQITESTYWYANGKIKSRDYRHDYLNKDTIINHQDYEDTLFSFQYYSSGLLKRKYIERNGWCIKEEEYYENGVVKLSASDFFYFEPHHVISYFENGKKKGDYNLYYELPIGETSEYYSNGQLKSKGSYTVYFSKLPDNSSRFYLETGIWMYYNEQGILLKKKNYGNRRFKNYTIKY